MCAIVNSGQTLGQRHKREWTWSPAEKAAAQRAFNLALNRELDAVMQEAKARAAKVEDPSSLWSLEEWLGERRKEIDRKYEYRYSVLPIVFAELLREGRLRKVDLDGLGLEKLESIRDLAVLR